VAAKAVTFDNVRLFSFRSLHHH